MARRRALQPFTAMAEAWMAVRTLGVHGNVQPLRDVRWITPTGELRVLTIHGPRTNASIHAYAKLSAAWNAASYDDSLRLTFRTLPNKPIRGW